MTDLLQALEDRSLSSEERLSRLLGMGTMPQPTLHTFACDCVERLLHFEEKGGTWWGLDPGWVAIQTKRAWLCGKATDEEMMKARDQADRFNGRNAPTDGSLAAAAAAGLAAYPAALSASQQALLVAQQYGTYQQELSWQLHHLISLARDMVMRRRRLAMILGWRQKHLSTQQTTWHQIYESALF